MNRHHHNLLLVTFAVLALALSACQSAAPAEVDTSAGEAQGARVAVLFPGEVTDGSWNEFGYEGLVRAQNECGVEIAYSENVFPDEQLSAFREYADGGYDIIIGHGGEYGEAALTVGFEYPDAEFGVTNGVVAGDNVSGIKVSYAQMGYLAGVLACNMTQTDHIGFVVGVKFPAMDQGASEFERGAQTCGKVVQVDYVETGDWADADLGYETAAELIDGGADVLWHILDAAETGLVKAAEDKGVYAIGLYRDSSDLGPDAIIGSALGSPGSLIYELACGHALNHELGFLDVNVENGVGIHMTHLTPDTVQATLNETFEQMKSGEIVVDP